MNNQWFQRTAILVFFFGILAAACMIPFVFESPSIFYKTGLDKMMLRGGKVMGIITAVLMLLQPFLAGQLPWLKKVWGLKKLIQFHRQNGVFLAVTGALHPVLILGADQFVFFPFEFKYWPEIAGIILLLLLVLLVVVSLWHKTLGMDYKIWQLIHKTAAPVILLLMIVHVLNVSRSFESGVPFYAVIGAGMITALVMIRKYVYRRSVL